LGQLGLSAFFDRFDPQSGGRGDDLDVIDEPRDATVPAEARDGAASSTPREAAAPSASPGTSGEISMALAQERIGQVVSALAFGRRSRRGIFGWLRSTLVKTVGAIVLARFRKKAASTSRINTASIRHELEAQIDDLLLARLRYTLFAWTLLVVAFLIAEVVVVSLIANRLAS
jgi:hypothetical protein